MKTSGERILTTHTGSLPRPESLVQMMYRREAGSAIDEAELEHAIGGAVRAIVENQIAAGLDVVNDGEMSKPSYATYIKDRLTGFAVGAPDDGSRVGAAQAEGGAPAKRFERSDLRDFP